MPRKFTLDYVPPRSISSMYVDVCIADGRPWFNLRQIATTLASEIDDCGEWYREKLASLPAHMKSRRKDKDGRLARGRGFYHSAWYVTWEGLRRILRREKGAEAELLLIWLDEGDGRAVLRGMGARY